MRLSEVLARRGALAAPEVVTLVVGLALDLASLHAAGRAHGNVRAEAVWFEPDGRPRLDRSAAEGSVAADLMALAALGLAVLGDQTPTGLVQALRAPARDANELAEQVMASGPAAPLRLSRAGEITRQEPGHSTSSRLPLLIAVVALALNVHVPRPEPWRDVLIALDRAREAAIVDRSVDGLREVYAVGSPQLARDTALIHGLVQRGLTLQGRPAALTDAVPLDVTSFEAVERPADYVLLDAHGHVVLRVHDQRTRRVVVRLRHTTNGWRVLDVS